MKSSYFMQLLNKLFIAIFFILCINFNIYADGEIKAIQVDVREDALDGNLTADSTTTVQDILEQVDNFTINTFTNDSNFITDADIPNNTTVLANTTARHSHTNKTFLDALATTDNLPEGTTNTYNPFGASISESELDISNSPTNDYYLKWNGVAMEWAFVTSGGGGGVWGSITGTLSAQTDLQNALDLKANIADLSTSNWNTAYTHSQLVTGNPHNVTKTEVGLGNVLNVDTTNADNISDGGTNAIITLTQESNFSTAYSNRVDSWTSPLSFSSNTASITQATTSTDGYLSSTDWNTFNNKLGISGNNTEILFNDSGSLGADSNFVFIKSDDRLETLDATIGAIGIDKTDNPTGTSWNLIDDGCDSFSSPNTWTDASNGGTVEQITFDTQETFHFSTPSFGEILNYARLEEQSINFTAYSTFSVEVKLYIDSVGNNTNNDWVWLMFGSTGHRLDIHLSNDGLFVYNGDWIEVGTDIVSTGEWATFRFDVDKTTPATATVDVYKNDSLIASGVDCSYTASLPKIVIQGKSSTSITEFYIDYVKGSDGYISLTYTDVPMVALTKTHARSNFILPTDTTKTNFYVEGKSHFKDDVKFDTGITINDFVLPDSDGTSNQVLTTNGSGTVSWSTPSYYSSPLTTKGDLLTYTTTDVRLAVGTDTYLLSANSSEATGLQWIDPSSVGTTTFTGLTDTPSSYSGEGGKYLKVTSGEDGVEFGTVSTYWVANVNDIYNSNSGNVGIGSTTPSQKLDVVGSAIISGNLTVNSNTLFVDAVNNILVSGGSAISQGNLEQGFYGQQIFGSLMGIITDAGSGTGGGSNATWLDDDCSVLPNGWTPTHLNSASDPVVDTGHYKYEVASATSGADFSYLIRNLTGIGNRVTVEATWTIDSRSSRVGVVTTGNYVAPTTLYWVDGSDYVYFILEYDGIYSISNVGGVVQESTFAFSTGVEYDVTVDIDVVGKSYDIYVDGDLKVENCTNLFNGAGASGDLWLMGAGYGNYAITARTNSVKIGDDLTAAGYVDLTTTSVFTLGEYHSSFIEENGSFNTKQNLAIEGYCEAGMGLFSAGILTVNGISNFYDKLIVDDNLLYVDTDSGFVGFNNLAPGYLIDADGDVNITGTLSVDTDTLYVNSLTQYVGIGTTSPGAELDVQGDVIINGDIAISTTDFVTDNVNGYTGVGIAKGSLNARLDVAGDVDVNGNSLVGASTVFASSGIGIGTTSVTEKLEVIYDTGVYIKTFRGTTDTDITGFEMKNADGEVCYVYPNADQNDIVVSSTKP